MATPDEASPKGYAATRLKESFAKAQARNEEDRDARLRAKYDPKSIQNRNYIETALRRNFPASIPEKQFQRLLNYAIDSFDHLATGSLVKAMTAIAVNPLAQVAIETKTNGQEAQGIVLTSSETAQRVSPKEQKSREEERSFWIQALRSENIHSARFAQLVALLTGTPIQAAISDYRAKEEASAGFSLGRMFSSGMSYLAAVFSGSDYSERTSSGGYSSGREMSGGSGGSSGGWGETISSWVPTWLNPWSAPVQTAERQPDSGWTVGGAVQTAADIVTSIPGVIANIPGAIAQAPQAVVDKVAEIGSGTVASQTLKKGKWYDGFVQTFAGAIRRGFNNVFGESQTGAAIAYWIPRYISDPGKALVDAGTGIKNTAVAAWGKLQGAYDVVTSSKTYSDMLAVASNAYTSAQNGLSQMVAGIPSLPSREAIANVASAYIPQVAKDLYNEPGNTLYKGFTNTVDLASNLVGLTPAPSEVAKVEPPKQPDEQSTLSRIAAAVPSLSDLKSYVGLGPAAAAKEAQAKLAEVKPPEPDTSSGPKVVAALTTDQPPKTAANTDVKPGNPKPADTKVAELPKPKAAAPTA